MTDKQVQISPGVLAQEHAALADYYRNRSMIQAQAVAELLAENADLKGRLAELETPAAAAAEAIEEGAE